MRRIPFVIEDPRLHLPLVICNSEDGIKNQAHEEQQKAKSPCDLDALRHLEESPCQESEKIQLPRRARSTWGEQGGPGLEPMPP